MSNQVYINQNDKYLPSIGVNIYKPSVFLSIPTSATLEVVWDSEITTTNQSDYTLDTSTGQITIINSGLYSIGATLELSDGTDPVNNDINYSATISYISPPVPAITLGTVIKRMPARGVSVGTNSFRENVSTTIYCHTGTVLAVSVGNFVPTNLLVQAAASQLNIQRIA